MRWVEYAKGKEYRERLDYYKHGYEFCLNGKNIFLELTHTSKNGAYDGKVRAGKSPEITRYISMECTEPYANLQYKVVCDSVIFGGIAVDKNIFFLAIKDIDRKTATYSIINTSIVIRNKNRIAFIKGGIMGEVRRRKR